jgi:3-dehydroquinate dehydratase/shikimate dehydrogenase
VTATRLCVTVTAPTMDVLRRRRDEVVDADLVELRLDGVADLDVAAALSGRHLPVIVTCRPTWEGGAYRGSEEERKRILAAAFAHGAEYVDIEWRAGFTDLLQATGGRRIVLSSHDFTGVPRDFAERTRAMLGTGAEIVKVAVAASRLSDCATLLEVATASAEARGRLVLIAMGDRGWVSRVCAAKFGSAWTYAGSLAGIGQLGPHALLNDYRFRSIGPATALYGVVGQPVSHSVSPAMHNAAFAAAALDAVYLPLPAADVDDFVEFARALSLRGASITIPYKVSLADQMADVDPLARAVGAVNTLRVDGDRWRGANTDVAGFLQPLRDRQVTLSALRVAVLGAGGSARAVVTGLTRAGAAVTVYARNRLRAEPLAQLGAQVASGECPPPRSWDLLVNCTPVGMQPLVDHSPLPPGALDGRLVYDLIYNPSPTRLLSEARAAGCEIIGGLEMLVAQAQDQFQWWTGIRPDAEVMKAAALRRLAEFRSDEDHVI